MPFSISFWWVILPILAIPAYKAAWILFLRKVFYPDSLSISSEFCFTLKDALDAWAYPTLVFLAALEEILFRVVPVLLCLLFSLLTNHLLLAFFFLLLVQIVFGFGHGSWKNIFFQGIIGIFYLATYFLAACANHPLVGVGICVVMHTLWNIGVMDGWYEGLLKAKTR